MYSQWMPQNLQKRLLLYILQQLSLFSEIDLPNLEEVSLNNIHLKDVLIDPEKVGKLPGCIIRYGKLRNVELSGGVVGGVNFDIDGVEIVAALNLDSLQSPHNNMLLILAQSTADLASTILFDEGGAGMKDPTDSDSSSDPVSTTKSPKKLFALGGVMSRAVEIALLRLQVKVSNISIKLLSDSADLVLHVDQFVFSSNNGSRKISVKGIRLCAIKAGVNPGHELNASNTDASESDSEEESEESAYVDASLMDSMVFTHEEASSIYMSANSHSSKSIADDLPSTGITASKEINMVYIGQIDVKFDGLNSVSNLLIDITTVRIATVPLFPTLSLVFNTLSRMLKLRNHSLKKKNHSSSRHPRNLYDETETYVNNVEPTDTSHLNNESQFLEKLRVSEVVICLTSAITSEGCIASKNDDINIVLRELTVKQKNLELIYGGVEKLTISRYLEGKEMILFQFNEMENSSKQETAGLSQSSSSNFSRLRADVRFEIFQKARQSGLLELTALLSKNAAFDIDCNSLQYLINFATYLKTIQENVASVIADLALMRKLKTPIKLAQDHTTSKAQTLVLLQTASIEVLVRLLDSESVKIVTLPILLNSLSGQLSSQRMILSLISKGLEVPFFSIPSLILDTRVKECHSFSMKKASSVPHKTLLRSSIALSCGKIEGSIDFKKLRSFFQTASRFIENLNDAKEKVNALPLFSSESAQNLKLSSSNLAASIYSNQTRYGRRKLHLRDDTSFEDQRGISSFRFYTKKIDFVIKELSKSFGDICVLFDHLEFSFQGSSVHGFVKDLVVERRLAESKIVEPLFSPFPKLNGSPVALFVHKTHEKLSSTDITLRKFSVNYYTQWLLLIEKEVTQGHNAEEIVHLAPTEDSQVKSHSDLRVKLIDCSIGLNPSNLKSKIGLAISKGNMDFTIGKEQFYIKCSFREPSVNLIDDVKRLQPKKFDSKTASVTVHEVLTKIGYTAIGRVNELHIGVTVNSDIEKLKSRNKRLGIHGDVSLLDIKINIDEFQAGLCGDSTYTFLQTLNDLKTPVFLLQNEKSRTTVESDFSLPDEILSQIEKIKDNTFFSKPTHLSLASEILERNDVSSNVFIVDEYYNTEETLCSEVEAGLNELGLDSSTSTNEESLLVLHEEHCSQKPETSAVNVYPFNLHLNISNVKVYLYDGYDWKHTRKLLRNAINILLEKATDVTKNKRKKNMPAKVDKFGGIDEPSEVRANKRQGNKVSFLKDEVFIVEPLIPQGLDANGYSEEGNEESNKEYTDLQISETIFQSIHLAVPKDGDPRNLVKMINSQVQFEMPGNDLTSRNPVVNENQINVDVKKYYKDLKLNRSEVHKVLVDLKNLEVILTNLTSRDPRNDPTSETEPEILNRVDLRVETVTIFDNVPTSTWNKMLTYMSSMGEREIGTDMLQLKMANVRPDPKLPFAEAIINFRLLPTRLYLDQDSIGFLSRFFEFKDVRFELSPEDPIYIQKLVVDPINLKFDYKPKKVDYAGIRSGQHAEFANFFILDGSDIHLKKATFYGIPGFSKLGEALAKVYGPYIQKYQLANILLGLSPLRPLVNIGGGVKSLITVPYKEYKRDKRLLRSIEKGTKSFAKTTTHELLKLGVKLASGTQVILENLEEYFGGEGKAARKLFVKDFRRIEEQPGRVAKVNKYNGLLQNSQILRKNTTGGNDRFAAPKMYRSASFDEEDEMDLDVILPLLVIGSGDEGDCSILIGPEGLNTGDDDEHGGEKDDGGDDDDDDEDIDDDDTENFNRDQGEKLVSLYSNQPSNAKEGLVSAYKSLGRNLKLTKKSLQRLKDDLVDSDTIQDLLTTIAKRSPVIIIRPVIGTTEAVVKTLMGISNQVDSRHIRDSRDKYRGDNSD